MRKSLGIFTALLLVAVMAGCGSKEGKYIGKWDGGGGSLEMKADHTFVQSVSGQNLMEGTWKFENDKATLTLVKAMGMDVSALPKGTAPEGIEATLAEDAKSLSLTMGGKDAVTLTKAEGS